MRTSLRLSSTPRFVVGAAVLGQNLEITTDTTHALLSDRLRNSKFLGPAHHQTGIAPEWLPRPTVTLAGTRCSLVAGMCYSGNESQLIQTFRPYMKGMGIQQNRVAVAAGEKLEVVLWAKPWHQPVTLRVGVSAASVRAEPYAQASIQVNAGYWKRYTAVLDIPRSDDEATLFITIDGEGMVYIDQAHLRPLGAPHVNPATIDVLRSMHIPVLRFPGGSLTTVFDWRNSIGPVERRPATNNPVNKGRLEYDFGTDDYLALCLEQGITPHITVNIGTGTPDDAAQWAAYCADFFRKRGVEPPFAYFHVGNEQDMVHESAHMTGPMYVEALRDFVPGIRRAYPNLRIIALGAEKSPGLRTEFDTPWRQIVLSEAGDLVDVLSLQVYKGQYKDNPDDQHLNAVLSAGKLTATIQKLVDDIHASGRNLKASCTEWNYWITHSPGRPQEPFAAIHAFFVAGVLNRFARMAEHVELSSFYQVFGGLGYVHRRGTGIEALCLADVFRLYRPAFPGALLDLELPSPLLVENEPTLDAIALRNDAGVWALIANRSPVEPAQIDVSSVHATRPAAHLLAADDPSAQLRPQPCRPDDPMPPLSLLRLHWPA